MYESPPPWPPVAAIAASAWRPWRWLGLTMLCCTAGVLLLSSGAAKETHVRLFIASIHASTICALLPRWGSARAGALRAAFALTYWLGLYKAFVDYQNRPWFAEAPAGSCDGACFGWYTFEFDPPYLALGLIGLASITLMIALRLVMRLVSRWLALVHTR